MALLTLSLNAQTTYYQKVTSQTDLTNGDYLIVETYSSTPRAFDGSKTTLDQRNNYISVSISDNKIASSETVDNATFTIDMTAGTIKSASGYYIGRTADSNGIHSSQTEQYTNTITVNSTTSAVDIVGSSGAVLRYNNSDEWFRYYKSSTYTNQKQVYLFKKITSATTAELTAPTNGSTVNVGTNTGSGVSKEITVSGNNLTADLTVSVNGTGFSVSPTTISAANANAGTNVTVTYNGTVENATGTLTISSSEVNTTVNLTATYNSGTTPTPDYGTLALFDTTRYVAEVLPVYGYNHDCTQHNQMIYPASLLTNMTGTTIKSMTFYPGTYSDGWSTYSGINFRNGTVTIKLMEVNGSTGFDSSNPAFITGTMSPVATITMPSTANTSATEWLIEFDNDYEYNGGDLVIDVTTTAGNFGTTYFQIGTTATLNVAYPGYYNYTGSYNGSGATNYVPRVTFTYEDNTTPVLTAPENGATVNVGTLEEGGETSVSVTVPVSGRNLTEDVTVNVSGTGFSVTPTTLSAADVNAGTTVTVTYEGTANGTGTLTFSSPELDEDVTVNLTATYISHDPTLTAPVDGSTVEVGNNSGLGVNKSIAVSGNYLTENLTVTVSGTGFRVSPTTLTAADVNAGTTITVTYTGTNPNATGTLTISSGEVSVTVNLTATYSTGIEPVVHGMVRMGTLPIVDQFAEKIPSTNDHPYRYTYFLKLASRDTTSSPARVPVQHTGAELQGYYSQTQMDEDTDPTNFLTTDMLSAEVDMNLSPASAPYFYTINSKLNGVPPTADDYNTYISVLQRREAGDYQEMYKPSNASLTGYTGNVYPSGPYDFFDFRNIRASQSSDSLSYVPIVWTKGIDRHYYTTDSLHNSYGAPLWEVRIGSVNVLTPVYERQAKNANGDWNASVNWYDEDNNPCSLFILKSLHATGVLPVGNVEYEPYMFRVWLICDGLRNMTTDPKTGKAVNDPDADRTSPRLLYTKYCHGADDLDLIITKDDTNWDNNVIFGGLNTIKPKFLVRFYYVVKGYQKTRGEADSDHVGYVVDEEANPMDPETAVIELSTNGTIVEQTFYNVQGMSSDKPFDGINIVVTRYSDGTVSTSKVIR